jgi:hypothetical protein
MHESSAWPNVKTRLQSEKDVHVAEQARSQKLAKLAALDLPLHTLELAILGDQTAIGKLIANEAKKKRIRDTMSPQP